MLKMYDCNHFVETCNAGRNTEYTNLSLLDDAAAATIVDLTRVNATTQRLHANA